MAPEVVFLTHQRLLMAQSVPRVTLEGHRGPDGQVCVRPCPVDWDTRIHAGVSVQRDHYRKGRVCRELLENVWSNPRKSKRYKVDAGGWVEPTLRRSLWISTLKYKLTPLKI